MQTRLQRQLWVMAKIRVVPRNFTPLTVNDHCQGFFDFYLAPAFRLPAMRKIKQERLRAVSVIDD